MNERRERGLVLALFLASAIAYAFVQLAHIPDARGRVGNDYCYVLPRLLAGAYWFERNGPFAIPWFTPAFAGGLPYYAHPATGWFSLPQALMILAGPLFAIRWTLFAGATLGALGTYLLLRGPLRCGRWAALLGAVLFQWNTFLVARVLVGHLPFHAIAFVPLGAWALLRRRPEGGGALGAFVSAVPTALVLAYQFQAGDFYGLPAACLVLLALAAVDHMRSGPHPGLVPRACCAAALAFLLGAAKLSGAVALTANFPRTEFSLPGFEGTFEALRALVRCLFLEAPASGAEADLVNRTFAHRRAEFEFGVSAVPLVLLAAGVLTLRFDRGWIRRHAVALVLLALALALPLAVNVYEPGWNQWLKSLPGIRSASSLTRWLVAYVPLACVAAALALERVVRRERWRPAVVLVLCAAACAQHLRMDRWDILANGYVPGTIEEASAVLRAGGGVVPIRLVGGPKHVGTTGLEPPLLDERLVEGVSQIRIFDPVFGYGFERYPVGTLHPGDPFELVAGEFNFKHPAAYLFPREMGRPPGGHMRAGEAADLAALLDYRPIAYEMSALHRWACRASVLGLLLVLAAAPLAWLRHRRARQRPASGPATTAAG